MISLTRDALAPPESSFWKKWLSGKVPRAQYRYLPWMARYTVVSCTPISRAVSSMRSGSRLYCPREGAGRGGQAADGLHALLHAGQGRAGLPGDLPDVAPADVQQVDADQVVAEGVGVRALPQLQLEAFLHRARADARGLQRLHGLQRPAGGIQGDAGLGGKLVQRLGEVAPGGAGAA